VLADHLVDELAAVLRELDLERAAVAGVRDPAHEAELLDVAVGGLDVLDGRVFTGMQLNLTPHESLTVVESSAERLVVDVTYAPGGSAPPTHYHPSQDEHFEVRSGVLGVKLGREKRELRAGDVLEIPRGTPHAMWNAGDAPATAVWTTSPAGRTLDWFRNLDAIPGKPGAISLAPALLAYDDVFRLAGPRWLIRPLLRVLTVLSRREVLVAAT
jgi:quercetin dioxygenase-like cupin family protein